MWQLEILIYIKSLLPTLGEDITANSVTTYENFRQDITEISIDVILIFSVLYT